jgi:DNA-binding XRE family transcriptional regulator
MAHRRKRPDTAVSRERRAQAVRLRGQGLTFAQIGARLGITRQAAHALVAGPRAVGAVEACCAACRAPLAGARRTVGEVLCRACLAGRTEVPFGLRLRSLRLAAGLTQRELARQAGRPRSSIKDYEAGRCRPGRATRRRLTHALGASDLAEAKPPAPKRPRGRRRKHRA